MARPGAAAACLHSRARTQRPMATLLHPRIVRFMSERRRAGGDGLGQARHWAVGVRFQRRPRASCGLIRSLFAAAVVASMVQPQGAVAQNRKRGEELLTRSCGSCHAVGVRGESPQKQAPPFRTLGQHYPIESLEEALGEGIMSGHPDMPEFKFDAADVGAIIAYLKSIHRQ